MINFVVKIVMIYVTYLPDDRRGLIQLISGLSIIGFLPLMAIFVYFEVFPRAWIMAEIDCC